MRMKDHLSPLLFINIMASKISFQYALHVFLFVIPSCTSIDTTSLNKSITDNQTLVSSAEKFVLGFFSPVGSLNRYVGTWYNNVRNQTVVWVANRENPLTDSSGILTINNSNLVILDGSSTVVWSTNVSTIADYSSARLLDSGNLVLSSGDYENNVKVVWESFDHPTNWFLPGIKLGKNARTGLDWYLTSWKSPNDPARGDFLLRINIQGIPQFFLMKGSDSRWRSGPWNGKRLSGSRSMDIEFISTNHYVSNDEETYLTYNRTDTSAISSLTLDTTGQLQWLTWIKRSQTWNPYWSSMEDRCDAYAECGAYAACTTNRVPCECFHGFEPKSPQDWSLRDGSDGCVRQARLECGKGDKFIKIERAKLPDTSIAHKVAGVRIDECKDVCLNNCSCTAYASADISQGESGCMIWDGDLIDLRVFSDGGQDFYVRVAASELENASVRKKKRLKPPLMVLVVVISILLGSSFLLAPFISYRRRRQLRLQAQRETSQEVLLFDQLGRNIAAANNFRDVNNLGRNGTDDSDFKLCSFATISAATDNFSAANELGKGGFGPVYKGKLVGGQEIAVKRLSRSSGQGLEEFKNEIILIAKLQHMNLVRLFGCSIEGDEKILIYEYMPNKSLDSFLFDPIKKALLHWGKRAHIIEGVAQGLLYLHKYSRLKVIHRDLKTSNILLDGEMNPKISDFGMARIFGCNESEGNTNKVVGTYGYMSPEYAVKGHFSIKSDVFSFGVILLEILSGRKNNSFHHSDRYLNVLGYAWELWEGGRVLELVDPMLGDSSPTFELLRCIHVALLCVQEHAADRPTMSDVVSMLGNETIALPTPKQPAFSLWED
ncbi:receptor-like serine/threonine-protein kinase SD1-8 [Magnolia sinica]|uniref:receptor-like serine/threonine-protein kinase SD1-8 n=1 Tax=Magnolia sinica TaxID=86752 RepID=UPI0026588979|nr:receptor-like serine/threonine-protein kinase SD1-8 [Magnolia sinica]